MAKQSVQESSNSIQNTRDLIKDLFQIKPHIFWIDLLLSASTGWAFFMAACLARPISIEMLLAIAISAAALYRSATFIHEISHSKAALSNKFIVVWHLLAGIPLLIPSFMHEDPHQDHHRLATYGTIQDPEYSAFANKPISIVLFLIHTFFIPALALIRFLILSPISLLLPSFHQWLEKRASTLAINFLYCRRLLSASERFYVKSVECAILGFWAIPLSLIGLGLLPVRVLGIWYGVAAIVYSVNGARSIVSHLYQGSGQTMDKRSQLLDSVDIPGQFWTVIWAPVGMRYHALHHYFPTIPYHNLPIAYERLAAHLMSDETYRQTTYRSFWHALQAVWIGKREAASD